MFLSPSLLEHEYFGGGQESSGEVRAAVSITSFPGRKTIRVSWNRRRISFQGFSAFLWRRKLRSFSRKLFLYGRSRTNGRGNKITNGTNRAFLVSRKLFYCAAAERRSHGIGRAVRRKSKVSHLQRERERERGVEGREHKYVYNVTTRNNCILWALFLLVCNRNSNDTKLRSFMELVMITTK